MNNKTAVFDSRNLRLRDSMERKKVTFVIPVRAKVNNRYFRIDYRHDKIEDQLEGWPMFDKFGYVKPWCNAGDIIQVKEPWATYSENTIHPNFVLYWGAKVSDFCSTRWRSAISLPSEFIRRRYKVTGIHVGKTGTYNEDCIYGTYPYDTKDLVEMEFYPRPWLRPDDWCWFIETEQMPSEGIELQDNMYCTRSSF